MSIEDTFVVIDKRLSNLEKKLAIAIFTLEKIALEVEHLGFKVEPTLEAKMAQAGLKEMEK